MQTSRQGAPVQSYQREGFTISTDRSLLNLDVIHSFLSTSYWAEGIPREVVERSIENSLCFGVYSGKQQVGFARVITDYATFGYLADVFILDSHRGHGLGKFLMECIVQHPGLQGFRRWTLATRDAHDLYAQFGFQSLKRPERFMELHNPDIYKSSTRANL